VDARADLLLETVTSEGEPLLYTFNREGLAEPRHENPGYALLGTGEITGGLLLMRLLGYSPKLADIGDAGLLSMFIIDMVSEVDPNVSPFLLPDSSVYIRHNPERREVTMGALTPEAFQEYKNRISEVKEILKKLWSIIEQGKEKEVSDTFEKLLSSEKSHRG
jgi:hypothetical protein